MSPHPSHLLKPSKENEKSEEYIPFISASAIPNVMSKNDVRKELIADGTLHETIRIIRLNKWHILDEIANL